MTEVKDIIDRIGFPCMYDDLKCIAPAIKKLENLLPNKWNFRPGGDCGYDNFVHTQTDNNKSYEVWICPATNSASISTSTETTLRWCQTLKNFDADKFTEKYLSIVGSTC